MDRLEACAKAFEQLLYVEYRIIIGRKNQTKELHIKFNKWDFHHLMGLGKLKDLHIAKKNREQVFDEILAGKITYQSIYNSKNIGLIENRFKGLACIESFFDSNYVVFRYSCNQNKFSRIEADYLLSSRCGKDEIYIFLSENNATNTFFCRSFFPKEKHDYTRGQAKYTLLYKEKINTATKERIVQYDRITSKDSR